MNIDFLKVLGNSALHFVFFGLNFLLLPNVIFKLMERIKNKQNNIPQWLTYVIWFFPSLINQLVDFLIKRPIMFITCNKRMAIPMKAPNGADTYTLTYQPAPWWNVWKQLGLYICDMITMLVNPAIAIILLGLLLPSTFSTVSVDIGRWVALINEKPTLELLKNMLGIFKSITVDGIILGGLEENFLFLALWLVLAIVVFGFLYIPLAIETNEEINGEIVRVRHPNLDMLCLPTVAIVFIVFNFITAFINYDFYLVISAIINSVGMVALFVILVEIAIWGIIGCSDFVIEKIIGIAPKREAN